MGLPSSHLKFILDTKLLQHRLKFDTGRMAVCCMDMIVYCIWLSNAIRHAETNLANLAKWRTIRFGKLQNFEMILGKSGGFEHGPR